MEIRVVRVQQPKNKPNDNELVWKIFYRPYVYYGL